MNKTFTVNLGGTVYNINDDAYELLDTYLKNLKSHFAHQEGGEEIVSDIEMRIAELVGEKLESPNQVITVADVEEIIKRMGKPEDLQGDAEDESSTQNRTENVGNNTDKGPRRLYRNTDDSILGGVLSGLAAYFDWDVTILRIVVILVSALMLHASLGTILVFYLIAWLVIPEAKTAAEKLAMHGKKIDMGSIGETVTAGYERASEFVKSKETKSVLRRMGELFVTFVGFCTKFLLVCLCIVLLPVLLLLLIASMALFFGGIGLVASVPAIFYELWPLVNWSAISASPLLTTIVAICGIVVVCIPVIALIHALMHHFGNAKPLGTWVRIMLVLLWLVALSVGIAVMIHVGVELFNHPPYHHFQALMHKNILF